jgi:hypothetical protein
MKVPSPKVVMFEATTVLSVESLRAVREKAFWPNTWFCAFDCRPDDTLGTML